MLPNRIFFTGVPGSRWSGVAQTLEQIPGMNTTDRGGTREYVHHNFTGHKGNYFGGGGNIPVKLDATHIDSAWKDPSAGCQLVKCHEWCDHWDKPEFDQHFKDDWKLLVYRPDYVAYGWWYECGGFQINWPDYTEYKDSAGILAEITRSNSLILDYARRHKCAWEYFSVEWIEREFGVTVPVEDKNFEDVLVTLIR